MQCDETTQDLLDRAERNGKIILEGEDTDQHRNKMIEEFLNTVVADTDYGKGNPWGRTHGEHN